MEVSEAKRLRALEDGPSGAGTREVELLSERPIEPGEPVYPQGGAGAQRTGIESKGLTYIETQRGWFYLGSLRNGIERPAAKVLIP